MELEMNMKKEIKEELLEDKLEQVYVVGDEGLHARPSGLIVRACETYPFKVNFITNDHEGYGNSVLSLMCLGVNAGELLKVSYTLPEKNSENYLELVTKLNVLESYISDVVQGRTKDKFEDYLKN